MPAEAKGTSQKSAKAFVRYYIDVLNFAAATGITRELDRLGTSKCQSCAALSSNITDIYKRDGHIESNGWRLDDARVIQSTDRRAVLSLDTFLEPQIVVSSAGHKERHDGGRQPMTLFVTRRIDRWLVTKLDLVS